jgi:hypothetical protein
MFLDNAHTYDLVTYDLVIYDLVTRMGRIKEAGTEPAAVFPKINRFLIYFQ